MPPVALPSMPLDGNAAAGLLADVFGHEMTRAWIVCGGCRAAAPLGTLAVYAHGMGTVVRCPGCDRALLRVARVRGGYRLDVRGAAAVDPAPEPGGRGDS